VEFLPLDFKVMETTRPAPVILKMERLSDQRAADGGGVVIHDDAAVENEECIMNDAAPVQSAIAI